MYEVDKYTVSLLHFDDGIKDETGKVWTANGNPVVSSTQCKIGGKSLYLDGSSYIKTNFVNEFDLSKGDFTIDWWEQRIDSTDNKVVFQIGAALVSGESMCVGSRYGNVAGVMGSDGSWNVMDGFSLGSIDLNRWNHFALVRSGNSFYTFKNGTLTNSLAVSSDTVIKIRQSDILIGSAIIENASSLNFHFNGYIDEFRISNIARWTKDFDPTASVTAPTNLTATAGNSQVTLSWTAVEGARCYIVKRSTTAGGEYITIANSVTDASYIDKSVTNGTTYYYVVAAVKGDLVSSNSNEASATPVGDGKALLCVTMIDSSEREYQLSTAEIDAFINWFSRTVGTGTTCYVLNKNVGVHNSKEYLAFEKIISFEVTDL